LEAKRFEKEKTRGHGKKTAKVLVEAGKGIHWRKRKEDTKN